MEKHSKEKKKSYVSGTKAIDDVATFIGYFLVKLANVKSMAFPIIFSHFFLVMFHGEQQN